MARFLSPFAYFVPFLFKNNDWEHVMLVKPPAPKHKSEDLGDKLVISIPSRRHWFSGIFQSFGLIMQIFLEILMIFLLILFARESDPMSRFFFMFLVLAIFTTAGLAYTFYGFLWQVLGREIVQVTAQSVTIRRVTVGSGSPKEYLAGYVRDLRLSPSSAGFRYAGLARFYILWFAVLSNAMGSLAFDYGAETFRFGAGIDEAEAKQILAEIQQKFPQYLGDGLSHS